ncbi:MAG: GDSL-type esterase/lipase family protein [Victivallales bacterium]|jgi:lysophospholipase L1-like esterase
MMILHKGFMVCASFVAAVSMTLTSGGFAAEILRDGFEKASWAVQQNCPGELTLVKDKAIARSGQGCAELRATVKGDNCYGRCFYLIGNAVVGRTQRELWGKCYNYTVYAKGDGMFRIGVLLYTRDDDKKKTISYIWPGKETALTGQYQKFEFNFNTSERNVWQFSLLAEVRGKDASAFIDDALLTEIENPEFKLTGCQRHLVLPAGSRQPDVSFQLTSADKPVPSAQMKLRISEVNSISDAKTDSGGIVQCPAGTAAVNQSATIQVTVSHPASGNVASSAIDFIPVERFDNLDSAAKKIKLKNPLRILYLGDSLSDFDRGHNYADKVDFFLNKYNPGKADFHNYGVGGDDIIRVCARIDGDPKAVRKERYAGLFACKYDIAFIFLGHNDTKASSANNYSVSIIPPEEQEQYYRKLIARLRSEGVPRIVLISPTSSDFDVCRANAGKAANSVHNRFGEPKHLEAFDAVLKKLAAELKAEHLDVYTPTRDCPDKPQLFRPNDGVHLSTLGHELVAVEILNFLGNDGNRGESQFRK